MQVDDMISKSRIDDTITDKSIPDPEVLPEITGWNLLIRPLDVREETSEGLLLADKTKEDMRYLRTVGQVKAMGPYCYDKYPEKWVTEGDIIAYPKNAGQRFKYKGVEYLLLHDESVLFKIKDPADLDSAYHLAN